MFSYKFEITIKFLVLILLIQLLLSYFVWSRRIFWEISDVRKLVYQYILFLGRVNLQ